MPPTTCRRAAPLICWPTRPLAHVRLHLHRSPAFSPLSSPALRTNFWVCLAQKLCQAATKHMKVAAARQRVELWMRCRIALHLYPIHLAVVGSSHGSQPRELNCPSTLTRGVWFRPHYAGSKPNGTKDAIPLEQQLGLCHMTVDLLVWFCSTNELSLNQKLLGFWFLLNLFQVQNPNFE